MVYSLIGIYHIPEPAGWDGLVAKAWRHQHHQHPCHWVWTGQPRAEWRNWTGYKRNCEHNGRQQPCTLESMWLHAWTDRTDTPYAHMPIDLNTGDVRLTRKQTSSTVRLSAVVTTDSQCGMQTSGRLETHVRPGAGIYLEVQT